MVENQALAQSCRALVDQTDRLALAANSQHLATAAPRPLDDYSGLGIVRPHDGGASRRQEFIE